MGHLGLLTGLAPDDPLAVHTVYECPDHGEYERLDHQSQECPRCGKQGEAI